MKEHGKKHGLLMLLCCLIPVALIALLPRLGINLGVFSRLAPLAVFLLCPLLHLGMMFFMVKDRHQDKDHCDKRELQ